VRSEESDAITLLVSNKAGRASELRGLRRYDPAGKQQSGTELVSSKEREAITRLVSKKAGRASELRGERRYYPAGQQQSQTGG
jgi:hypothetical protein